MKRKKLNKIIGVICLKTFFSLFFVITLLTTTVGCGSKTVVMDPLYFEIYENRNLALDIKDYDGEFHFFDEQYETSQGIGLGDHWSEVQEAYAGLPAKVFTYMANGYGGRIKETEKEETVNNIAKFKLKDDQVLVNVEIGYIMINDRILSLQEAGKGIAEETDSVVCYALAFAFLNNGIIHSALIYSNPPGLLASFKNTPYDGDDWYQKFMGLGYKEAAEFITDRVKEAEIKYGGKFE